MGFKGQIPWNKGSTKDTDERIRAYGKTESKSKKKLFASEEGNSVRLNVNGKKTLIELFGSYWHKPEDEQLRKEHFQQFGFNTVVIWDYEVNNSVVLRSKLAEACST